jgi:hypothetical protein
MEKEINDGGNTTTENVVDLQVENENLKVYMEGEGDQQKVSRIEFPPEKADDKEWQEKAVKKINLTSLEYKNNLDRKKQLEAIKKEQEELGALKGDLKNMLSIKEPQQLEFTKEVLKELKAEKGMSLADFDADDINKASQKVAENYRNSLVGTQGNSELMNTIINENPPDKIKEFMQWAKGNLGAKEITPLMYAHWKQSVKTKDVNSNEVFNKLAEIQLDSIPFVPAGSKAVAMSANERIHKKNAEVLLKNIRRA